MMQITMKATTTPKVQSGRDSSMMVILIKMRTTLPQGIRLKNLRIEREETCLTETTTLPEAKDIVPIDSIREGARGGRHSKLTGISRAEEGIIQKITGQVVLTFKKKQSRESSEVVKCPLGQKVISAGWGLQRKTETICARIATRGYLTSETKWGRLTTPFS